MKIDPRFSALSVKHTGAIPKYVLQQDVQKLVSDRVHGNKRDLISVRFVH